MAQRKGKLEARAVRNVSHHTILPIVDANIEKVLAFTPMSFVFMTPCPQWVTNTQVRSTRSKDLRLGDAHTNTIKGFWALSKNGIRGVYHSVSAKYLQHYLDKYSFRYNHRDDVRAMFFSFLSCVKPAPMDA